MDAVVVADDSPAGHVLRDRDLMVRSMPESLVPAGAASTRRHWRGRTLSGPIRAGAVLTDSDVSVAALARGQPRGVVVAHLDLPSASLAGAASPGTRVEVVSSADGTVLADNALVLAHSSSADEPGSPGVFVAVTSSQARQIAVAGAAGGPLGAPTSGLTLVLLPPERGSPPGTE